MRLITGPAGSGKTYAVLQEFRKALQQRNRRVRLLVPTATMVRFLRNLLAREGYVFPPEQIFTLNRFLEPLAPQFRAAPEPLLHFTVEQAIRETARPEFARVAEMPGFYASLARTIAEFSAAGCDSGRLARHLPDTPLGEAFLEVYRAADRLLAARGLCLRHERLAAVTAAIEQEGIGNVETIWLDGFFALTDPELAMIAALSRRAEVAVTLATTTITQLTRDRLLAMGFREERCSFTPPAAQTTLVEAATIERECDEIARRILEQVAAGRAFRDIGIIVRSPELYGAPLRAALERFGVPARFFFERPLLEVASAAYCAGAVESLLSGWDFERTLQWLRSAAVAVGTPIDGFDFAVRRAMPGHGLDGLRQLAGDHAGLTRLLEAAQALESWREGKASARDWGVRLAGVVSLYRPARPFARPQHEDTLDWREHAAALKSFTEAMEQTSASFPPEARLSLAEFWRAASAVLRLAMHRVDDLRRNVVNVLTAFEARQWRLPVIFVCGLVEKQFPKYQPQNPFFPDAARRVLKQAGLRLRASEDVDQEEAFLFESAVGRASETLILSYPKADARGEQNLRSLYLDRLLLPEPVTARSVRPRSDIAPAPQPEVRIASPHRLQRLQTRHVAMKPTALEQFAQCPFQFFANQTLRLQAAPPRPEERLDFLFRGNVVHRVIGEWTTNPQPLESLFERVFEEAALQNGIVPGYRTETIRQALLDDLRRFIEDTQWPPGFTTQTEVDFRYVLTPGLEVRGRIDRLDRSHDGRAYIIDYKYSKKDYTKNELLLQGPLYLMAAERCFDLQPGAMYYCGVRDRVKYSGWCHDTAPIAVQPITPEWLEAAVTTTVNAAAEIRAGRIAPNPADPDACRYCDFKDICRIDVAAASTLAEGA